MSCPDCGVSAGETHKPNCDVEQCPSCGYQALQCLSGNEGNFHCENTGLSVDEKDLLPWTGEWPGYSECREYGFYCKEGGIGVGWVPCSKDDPEARPDLNKLHIECIWDRDKKKFVLNINETAIEETFSP